MLEFNTTLYRDLMEMSFKAQFKRGLDGQGTTVGRTMLISTSIDLGRQTGKTEALVQKVIDDTRAGIFTYYVGHNMDASEHFVRRIKEANADIRVVVGITSKRSKFVDSCRGVSQHAQAVNIIFDECGMSHEEQSEFVKSVVQQMGRGPKTHPYPYIHAIRVGM